MVIAEFRLQIGEDIRTALNLANGVHVDSSSGRSVAGRLVPDAE